jgi:MarC family membrane protein
MPNFNNTIAIFFLLNAFSSLPLFLALTKAEDFGKKIRIALVSNFTAIILLSSFIWAGDKLMVFFGLSLSAFEIGGGIILFKIAMEMINCTLSIEGYIKQASKIDSQGSPAIVPLGIPLLAGPGSIAVLMTMTVSKAGGAGPISLTMSLLLACFLSFIVWTLGGYIFLKYKGDVVRDLISKLGGLFLLILSVQMLINGLTKVIFHE